MNDKRRKYAAVVSAEPKLLDRYPTSIHRIEEELVYRLTDPIVEEAIKGECIVRLTETEQQKGFPTYMIAFRKYVYIEEIVRCKDCKWRDEPGCAIRIVDESDRPEDGDYCSFGERRADDTR